MSDLQCNSRAQCRLSGVFGTAVALSALGAGWAGADVVLSGGSVAQMAAAYATWLAPAVVAVGWAIWLKLAHRVPGILTTGAAVLAALWTVFALNTVVMT